MNKSSKEFRQFKTRTQSPHLTQQSHSISSGKQVAAPTASINQNASSSASNSFNNIEKEATKLSIKSGYETPLTCRYGDVTDDHNYLDLSHNSIQQFQQQQQRLKAQSDSARGLPTPDLYQSLENPSNLNIYSELNTIQLTRGDLHRHSYQQNQQQQQQQQRKLHTTQLIRPLVHTNRPRHVDQHRNSLDGSNITVRAHQSRDVCLLSTCV
jgi:hypothetical protein